MQKVFQRTTYVQKQALRRARKAEELKVWKERKVQLREKKNVEKIKSQLYKDVRQQQQEDWKLGILAPRRDVGDNNLNYGTLNWQLLHGRDVPKRNRVKYWNLAKGDRVALLAGPDKGKIGIISIMDKEKQTVTVKGLNMVYNPYAQSSRMYSQSSARALTSEIHSTRFMFQNSYVKTIQVNHRSERPRDR